MYFEKEDLDFIRDWLAQNGTKDSDFDSVSNLTGDEWFALVKGKKNWKISSALLKHLLSNGDVQTLGGIQVVPSYEDLAGLTAKTYGNLVYVSNEDRYYSWSASNEWHAISKIYVGTTEPADKNVLWIDEDDEVTLNEEEDEDMAAIKKAIISLTQNQNKLLKLLKYGVVPGDSTVSVRQDAMSEADPVEPVVDEETGELTSGEEGEETEPDTSEYDSTVPAVNAKLDTAQNFGKNKANLTDGELLFYTDKKQFKVFYQGSFFGGGSGSSSGGGGLSLDELYASDLEYLVFSDGESNYKVQVLPGGNFVCKKYSREVTTIGSMDGTWKVYISQYLNINTVFCGGEGSEECACSHNFVELANGSDKDINLNGLMLLYTDGTSSGGTGFAWKTLQLNGVIKANSTFLIRGAQCNTLKQSFIRLDSCDMEWYDGSDLIKFSQTKASFYLAVCNQSEDWVYDTNGAILDKKSLRSPWLSVGTYQGYVDSCGFGTNAVAEGGQPLIPEAEDSWNKIMFIRWFMFEPAKQGNKNYSARTTSALWTYINLDRHDYKLGNSEQYYYPDYMKQRFAPKTQAEGKDFFTNKSIFDVAKPNIINITFGIQATSNDATGLRASRCFNWVSVGYYDEFLQYRKKGTDEWTKVYSIEENDASLPSNISKFLNHYKRLRWCSSNGTWVTTHKVVLHEIFSSGTYEYRVGRKNDESYYSPIMEFTVADNSTLSSFSFIQTSDQQGFNWAEYTAWKKSAYWINKSEDNYNFTVNTGDITQSGNRENEWLDYYDGRQFLRNKEEMFTVGNNDLCGHDATRLTDGNDASSKYNHINVVRYFCFELDPQNTYSFEWEDQTYPIYSLYSFNYGSYHFVCLNSETAQASSKTYKDWENEALPGDASYAQALNATIEDWFKKDLQIWQNTEGEPANCSKAIVYLHEMPFTTVTWSFMKSASATRAGSHLNTLNSRGNYRFSRLFKKYGIRLVMGGHKHTYTISKPIYDAPEGYISAGHTINPDIDLMGALDSKDLMSRVPVVQVTSASDVQQNNFARYEVVEKISAPTYVMSQATGYKLVSNKEQPSGDEFTIPWLLSYFRPTTNEATPTENVAQHFPMYIRYDLSEDQIVVTAKQIHGIWDTNVDKNTKKYNMNKQLTQLSAESMTLSTITDADKQAYDIKTTDSYTINL